MIGKGIKINNIHSYRDLGVSIKSKTIGQPALNRIVDSVPFMNGVYDFTEIAGFESHGERTLTYVFEIIESNKERMNAKKVQLINFFKRNTANKPLIDDAIKGYYFLINRCGDPSFKEDGLIGTLTVTFYTYPYKIKNDYEGSLTWDDFCFLTDVLQETKFTCSGSKTITIINYGVNVVPSIICDSSFDIIKDGLAYSVSAGTTTNYAFSLSPGENIIKLTGNGSIEFKFKSEVL